MVITFGVELPMEFILFIDAALAKSDPVRLLKAGTVVSCIAGAETGIWVIAVGTRKMIPLLNVVKVFYTNTCIIKFCYYQISKSLLQSNIEKNSYLSQLDLLWLLLQIWKMLLLT